ncbi:hypothetical protein EJC49_07840 [Aquibium carbonis]|uniref:Uncharacterized protein n=1 Tax=Aquibium carbonis TaxID=2495581 RepID=A0A3S0AA01_9HYPH|nr:hypothetical protein [Aquibium carbonis]RST86979.1 hypothetical protein EJC49_07840 [Aquibium carbonis]
MSRRHGLDGLARWAERDDWAEHFDEVFDRHFGDILDDRDLDFEELDELIGEAQADMLWAWAFEDFATRPRPDDGQTVIDDYLKRRGWKESVTNRRYLEALKSSVVGFWAVVEVQPRRSVTLRDLLGDTETVVLDDPALADALRQGDQFAARVVEISGRMRIAGATLVFPDPMTDLLLEGMQALMQNYRTEVRAAVHESDPAGELADETIDDMFMLAFAGAFFGGAWLDGVLSDLLEDETATAINLEGEPILFHTMRFALARRAASLSLRARLDDAPGLTRDGADRWLWLADAKPLPVADGERAVFAELVEGGREVAGRLELKAGTLTLVVNSAARALRGQALIREAVEDLLGEPETTSQTLAQHLEANPQAAAHLVEGPRQ